MTSRQVAVAALACVLSLTTASSGDVIYVRCGLTTGENNGTSWNDAFQNLQDALDDATSGDQIWVKRGTCYPDVGTLVNDGDEGASFTLESGVEVYGGFVGTETELGFRPTPNPADPDTMTTLNGDIDQDDGGVAPEDDNTDHIVDGSTCDDTALLDGFHVTKGYVDESAGTWQNGAGLLVGTLTGGGVEGPVVRNCRFSYNRAERGGAAYNFWADTQFQRCHFVSNVAELHGGAVYTNGGDYASPVRGDALFIRCAFQWNEAQGTTSDNGGGAVLSGNCAPKFLNCKFLGNGVSGAGSVVRGGAVRVVAGEGEHGAAGEADGTLFANCEFVGNHGADLGGALDVDCNPGEGTSTVTVVNCSFSKNEADDKYGGIRNDRGTLVVKNTILWGNTDDDGSTTTEDAQLKDDGTGSITAAYDCIEGLSGFAGNNNTGGDPEFLGTPGPGQDSVWGTSDDDFGDLRLSSAEGSSAIDKADIESLPQDAYDLDGDGVTAEGLPLDLDEKPRRVDDPDTGNVGGETPPVVDMGAHEYFPDCNSNGIPDVCDISCGDEHGMCDVPGCGESYDCNSDGVPEECESYSIEAMNTCYTHGEAGVFCIDIVADAIEPRLGDLDTVEFEMDHCISEVVVAVSCAETTYSGTITPGPDGTSTFTVTFNPPLPDNDACKISLNAPVFEAVCLKKLEADVDQSGLVNSVDASTIKPYWGDDVDAQTFIYDVTNDGIINSVDSAAVQPRYSNTVGDCPQ